MQKPYSQACENNKRPILDVISPIMMDVSNVLEIGSGTGQHAVFFAEKMPHLRWHCSDVVAHHAGIQCWIDDAALTNVVDPIPLNVNDLWPQRRFDVVFTANTFHIMAWSEVCRLIEQAPSVLLPKGFLVVYGPFNYQGLHTSDSNRAFDEMLRARDPLSGIRDIETVSEKMMQHGFTLHADHALPANNRCLIWRLTGQI